MRIAIVGGGILGLTLGYRLGSRGHRVEIFEAAPQPGGLATWHDYGDFAWDRFYHCILPQDLHLIGLLREIGLGPELRWSRTGTGYFAGGKSYSMSGMGDFLRFPLLSVLQKARLAAAIVYASRLANPHKLHGITAAAWLERLCGRRTYGVFWRPLLVAKLGEYHDRVAATFIWATLKRLLGARSPGTQREKLGYVSGGYRRILSRLGEVLRERGVLLHLGSPVERIELLGSYRGRRGGAHGPGGAGRPGETHGAASGGRIACRLRCASSGGGAGELEFDQVFFTGPTALARKVVAEELLPVVDRTEREYPAGSQHLGVICAALVLRRRLTPYYVLNIGEESVGLTGLIEMTSLIDPAKETGGRHLVYLPRYLSSEDPLFNADDDEIRRRFIDHGLRSLFPGLEPSGIVGSFVHRARHVQPLPLAGSSPTPERGAPALQRPLQLLGTFLLQCATLNNNEVVGLVDRFVERNGTELDAAGTAADAA